ncbi:MAG: hypothetical protein MI923_18685 [Phycisphaerales bacterium]|nr:hypothetical protein [Phycisphaerales bacterium]
MGATLEALHRLQEIELQIAEIQQRIDRKVRGCTRQKQRISELEERVRGQQEQQRADQIEADSLDVDVRAVEEEIAKLRVALNTSKSNREYHAVLTQLNTKKADKSKLEERGLGLLSQIDEKKKQCGVIEDERDKEVAKLKELEAGVTAAEEEASDRLNRLRSEREQAAAEVPQDALLMFNRVAGKNEGEAMAAVIRTHPKRQEYACDGCNMSITIEQVNSILSRDEAVLCNVCGRILYLESPAASGAR